MDVFDLYAKISLDTSEYESGVSTAKKSSQQYKSDVMKLATQYKKSGMDMSEAMKKAYSEIDKSAYESSSTTQKSAKKAKDAFEELGNSAKDAADKTGSSWDDLTASIKNIESKFSTLTTAFKGAAIVKGVQTVVSAFLELEESTEEYRVAMGKLNTAFETAGYTANDAKEAYTGLYAIIGDTDTATEAAQLMAKLSDSTEDLSTWVDIAAGAYGTFGDALPINSLIEATNETVKVGEVTGVLADALNWAGISEDDFNAALSECTDEAERNQLIMDVLAETYDDASDAFYANNEQVVQNRENQAMLDEALGNVGDSVSALKNKLLQEFTPAIVEASNATAGLLDTLADESTWQKIGYNLNYVQAFVQQFMTTGDWSGSAQVAASVAAGATKGQNKAPSVIPSQKQTVPGYSFALPGVDATPGQTLASQNKKQQTVNPFEFVSNGGSSSSGGGSSSSGGSSSGTSAAKKAVEEQKTYLEQLQDAYKETADVLTAEVDNTSLAYEIWAEQAGDSIEESEKLAKQLESLTAQHEAQQKIVDAAQKAYDDYAASQDYTEAGAAELKNTLLQEQLALAKLQTDIDETSESLEKATDKTEQFKTALDAAFEETNDFGSAITSLGNNASDLGDILGIELVSDIGSMISKMGGGISSVIGFASSLIEVANSVSAVTSTLQTLSSVSGSLSGGGGLLSTIGSIFGGSTGILGAVGVVGGALTGQSWAAGISSIKDLWSSESSLANKITGTIQDLIYYGSGWGGILDKVMGKDEEETEDELKTDIGSSITTGTVSGTISSAGQTIIEKVEIYIEGSQYKDEDSLAEAISIKLQNLTERRVNVFA